MARQRAVIRLSRGTGGRGASEAAASARSIFQSSARYGSALARARRASSPAVRSSPPATQRRKCAAAAASAKPGSPVRVGEDGCSPPRSSAPGGARKLASASVIARASAGASLARNSSARRSNAWRTPADNASAAPGSNRELAAASARSKARLGGAGLSSYVGVSLGGALICGRRARHAKRGVDAGEGLLGFQGFARIIRRVQAAGIQGRAP